MSTVSQIHCLVLMRNFGGGARTPTVPYPTFQAKAKIALTFPQHTLHVRRMNDLQAPDAFSGLCTHNAL